MSEIEISLSHLEQMIGERELWIERLTGLGFDELSVKVLTSGPLLLKFLASASPPNSPLHADAERVLSVLGLRVERPTRVPTSAKCAHGVPLWDAVCGRCEECLKDRKVDQQLENIRKWWAERNGPPEWTGL